MFIKKKNIHLDFASTTPVGREVLRAMKPYFAERFFNPSSSYAEAQAVKKKIRESRASIARFFQVRDNEVIFTQGGTESCNLAILGFAKHARQQFGFVPHAIFSAIEHPAVAECIPVLRQWGFEVDIVPVTERGIIDTQALEKLLTERTVLISCILVSNEVGTIQPLHKISSIVKKFKNKLHRSFDQFPYIHTDASQAVLTEPVFVSKLGADMISVDGSKIYAPKMSGLLIKKNHVTIEPMHYGGGQEFGLRSGTEHAASVVGIAKALEVIAQRREKDADHFKKLKEIFMHEINQSGIAYTHNGDMGEDAVHHIVNICIEGLNSDFAVIQLDELGVNVSAMTACASSKGMPKSEVITAMGRPDCAGSSLRFSFGRATTASEIRKSIHMLKIVCQKQNIR